LFPDSSYAWASGEDIDNARRAALRAWIGDSYRSIPGNRDEAIIQLALHNNLQEPFDDERFQRYAQRVFAPAIAHGGPVD
jgi:hypothetical protein